MIGILFGFQGIFVIWLVVFEPKLCVLFKNVMYLYYVLVDDFVFYVYCSFVRVMFVGISMKYPITVSTLYTCSLLLQGWILFVVCIWLYIVFVEKKGLYFTERKDQAACHCTKLLRSVAQTRQAVSLQTR